MIPARPPLSLGPTCGPNLLRCATVALPWVGAGVLAITAALIFAKPRNGQPVPPLSDDERASLLQALTVVARSRGRSARVDSAEVLVAVSRIMRLRSALLARASETEAPMPMPEPPPVPNNVRKLIERVRSLDSEITAPRLRRDSRLELAAAIAPLSTQTPALVWEEVYCGGVDSVAALREVALEKLTRYLEQRRLSLPASVQRDLEQAVVVPHDAPDLPAVSLHRASVPWARACALVYRPDQLLPGVAEMFTPGPNAIEAFEGVRGERHPLKSPPASRSAKQCRAMLRMIIRETVRGAIEKCWCGSFTWRGGPSLADEINHTLVPVWGRAMDREEMAEALTAAVARVFADLVWGEYVPPVYHQSFGLAQLLSLALTRMADPERASDALFGGDASAMQVLGAAWLEQARALKDSLEKVERKSP